MLVTLRFSPKFSTIRKFHFELMLINNPVSFRWIMYVEKKICDCDGTIILYHENIRRIKRR